MTDSDVERVADRIQERMGPLFGSPEYLADPVKRARAEKRQRESAVSYAQIAVEETRAALSATPMAKMRDASLIDVWAQARRNHEAYSATGDREHDIRFFALGLTGEAGEVANFVKKRWRDGDGHDEDLRKECADVLAYTMMLADALGMTPQSLIEMVAYKQQVFIEKMRARAALTGEAP